MPYLITAGRARCTLCGVDVDNRAAAKVRHRCKPRPVPEWLAKARARARGEGQ